MIIDARQLNADATLRGSVAVVGGGAAGITLALELAQHFRDVLLLESGATAFELETQDLYRGDLSGHTQPALDTSRLRFLGGTTNHWHGQCAPLDSVDFERLPDRPYSGWPIDSATLAQFYARAIRYCEISRFGTPTESIRRSAEKIVSSPELQLTEFRYSPPTRFGERFRRDLASSDRIKLYLNANVTNISAVENGTAITSIEAQTLTGRKLTVTASAFILCCGGIENARILLNCRHRFPSGIGNEHDLVGRFFMDHLVAVAGLVVPQTARSDLSPFHTWNDASTLVRGALKNSPDTVRQPGRRGCSAIMHPGHQTIEWMAQAMQSRSYQAFRRLAQYAKRGNLPSDLGTDVCIALEEPQDIARIFYNRLAHGIQPGRPVQTILVHLEGEQSPHPDSRVRLTGDVDALGMRRIALDWRIDPEDVSNLYTTALQVARGVGSAGFGRMALELDKENDGSEISTGFHHMGTTRMHDDPRQGVVDRNCAIHGLANFYVAGSSVFPTGGRANPTLTIVALAIRLADHLKVTVKHP